jgi:hypothetical protein
MDRAQVGVSAIGELSCVPQSYASEFEALLSTAADVATVSGESVASLTIRHYFVSAGALCKYITSMADIHWCEALGHLCAMQLYSSSTDVSYSWRSHTEGLTLFPQACAQFESIASARAEVHGVSGWATYMPWIRYADTGTAVNQDTGIQMTMAFAAATGVDRLNLVVSKHTLNGTWLGYEDASTLLFYCGMPAPDTASGGGTSSPTTWLYYGRTEKHTFLCNLSSLIDQPLMFYDMYVIDEVTRALRAGLA